VRLLKRFFGRDIILFYTKVNIDIIYLHLPAEWRMDTL
jgi:hypothetical protein